jgi:hypothetical protein
MTPSESLKAFLKSKKERDDAAPGPADVERRREARQRAIERLHDDIKRWLSASIGDGTVTVTQEDVAFDDSRLGRMTAKSLELQVGRSKVRFYPVGGTIAGASSRVDMSAGDRTVPIVELPERGWHFLVREPVTTPVPVTEESFADALEQILDE